MADGSGTGLLAGEKVLQESHSGALLVTNLRVVLHASASGTSKYLSIALDRVASCSMATTTYPLLLVFAALAAVCGLLTDDIVRVVSFVVAIGLAIGYVVTRQELVKIASMGGDHIAVPTSGANHEALLSLLTKIDEARMSLVASRHS